MSAMSDQTPTRPVFIYALCDSRTTEVRYIGSTISLSARLHAHLSVRHRKRTPWIQGLLADGLQPTVVTLDVVHSGNRAVVEEKWIRHFKNLGADLLNETPHGGGGLFRPRTDDEKRRISSAQKGRRLSEEHRAKMRRPRPHAKVWNRGKAWSEEMRERISQKLMGYKNSENQREAASRTWKGRKRGPMPLAQRQKVSASKLGKPLTMTTEQLSARGRSVAASRERNGNAGKNGWFPRCLTPEQAAERGRKIWAARRANGTVLWKRHKHNNARQVTI